MTIPADVTRAEPEVTDRFSPDGEEQEAKRETPSERGENQKRWKQKD